jgi:putative addiction module killer protein
MVRSTAGATRCQGSYRCHPHGPRAPVERQRGVGEGVLERKIDWGPGYRVYFGRDGDDLIILLGGGTKKLQENDIRLAKER